MKSSLLFSLLLLLTPPVVMAADSAGAPTPAPIQAATVSDYETYSNGRFGFSIDFPRKLLIPQGVADNGDGQTFISHDGKTRLAVWGSNNSADPSEPADTPKTAYAKALKAINKEGKRQLTLKLQKDNWFVLSGFEGANIFYRKVYFIKNQFIHFEISYPTAQREQWDAVAAKLAKSFKP
jgi:hypothetical protein